jgi:hypothetical protein
MATDYEVLKAETVWHVDPSQGVKGSDKVYSVQLVKNLKTNYYSVESQYGKRGYNLKAAPTFCTTLSQSYAESRYNELLQSKVCGTKGDAYDRKLDKPIIPVVFGGAGFSREITKAAELKTAKQVDSLYNWLKTEPVIETEAPAEEVSEVSDAVAAMLAAFGEK